MSEETRQIESNKDGFWYHVRSYTSEKMDESFVNEIADGVIFYLRSISELKKTIQKMQEKKEIDVACQIITCVSHDSQKAIDRAKQTLAFYISVGKIYRELMVLEHNQ